jgi:Flp pilus assembly protein CpaB
VQAADVTAVHVRLPDSMLRAAYDSASVDQLIGRRVSVHVAAGEMLSPAQFATEHVTVGPGRIQATIPVESSMASAGLVGPGDSVVVYASPRQAASMDAATTLVAQARVVAVGRADQGASAGSTGSSNRPLWVTLDLDPDQAARVEGASRSAYIDLALVGTGEAGTDQ